MLNGIMKGRFSHFWNGVREANKFWEYPTPLEKEPESCRWHLPPFCALADLASEWNDIDEWFPEPRWGSDVPRNALGVPARRGWTATDGGGGHMLPPTTEAPFSGPHFQVVSFDGCISNFCGGVQGYSTKCMARIYAESHAQGKECWFEVSMRV